MSLRAVTAAIAAFTFIALSLPAAFATSGECALSDDKSTLQLSVGNTGDDTRYACTATCQYTVAGQRPLQTFSCNYRLDANEAEKIACDLDGTGPGYFAELRPTKYVCQPR